MLNYRVAPIFLIRAAGVPFEILERLGTTQTAKLGRDLLARRAERALALEEAERFVGSRDTGLSATDSRAFRSAMRGGAVSAESAAALPPAVAKLIAASSAVAGVDALLQGTLERELDVARAQLAKSSQAVLPGYLVFGAGRFRDRLQDGAKGETLPSRNARVRERERHFLLYLQRVCAKNDTFSAFGPSAWGTIDGQPQRVAFAPSAGVAQREVFLERWTAHLFAAALHGDPEVWPELAPRLNPVGRLEGQSFVLEDSGVTVDLSEAQLAIVAACDGRTAARALGCNQELLEELAELRVVIWECEVPSLDPHAFGSLVSDIKKWSAGAVRSRWLERAHTIAELPRRFAETQEPAARAVIMAEAQRLLDELGPRASSGQRFLYSASNPIAEECSRTSGFSVSETMMDEFAADAQPWFDLWRDTYAYVASRVAAGLRGLFMTAPRRNGAVLLPAFLEHCAANKLPLTNQGLVVLAHLAFQEVKAAFRQMVNARPDAPEWELTSEDCKFVRRQFDFGPFDEFTYPSADLQLSARSFAAVNEGDYQWLISELHPPIALLHHGLYWSCPDQPALARALAAAACHQRGVHFGFFAADFTAHTTVRQMDALPDLMTFVANGRSNPRWKTVPPAEVEVFIDESTHDVALRTRGAKEYLGSFARSWVIPLGFHPFFFGRAPHMPRLRCGKVIVQRRAWTVALEEFGAGDHTGISRELVLSVERLRAEKDWPRYVYIRPTEQALRRSGVEGRDKDTKPVFIDFESYLSLEIFHRWLTKAGELEVTEMLPDPEHLCWQEADGRRTFELRTLVVPRT